MADTLFSRFLVTTAQFPDRTAYTSFDGAWRSRTYAEVLSLTRRLAAVIAERGAAKGDRIALVAENRPEWCAAYLAIVGCGAVAVPIDIQLGAEEVANLVGNADAKALFFSAKTAAVVARALEGGGRQGINLDELPPVAAGAPLPPAAEETAVLPEDLASIIYTSGTTGVPKGVMLTHRNFCADADALIKVGLVTYEDRVLSILPLHHTYPFMCTFLLPLFLGGSVTFGPGLKSAELMAAIRETRVTVVVGVPRLFEMIGSGIRAKLQERGALGGVFLRLLRLCGAVRKATGLNAGKVVFGRVHDNFPALRFFASGGARLDPAVMEDLEALGFTVLEGYGLTETSPVVTFTPPAKRKPGSVGIPLEGAEVAIAESGEIMVRGPMVMKGYYYNPTATADALNDGWFLTGDLGSLDSEGYLFITGRKKEVIVLSSGKNIYPEEVEKAYLVTPLIKELCVVPAPTPGGRGAADAIHAVIVPDVDYARTVSIGAIAEALNDAVLSVSSRLPDYMRVRGFTLVTEPLPRTPLGKLRRFMVQDMLKARLETRPGARPEEPHKEEASLGTDETGRKVLEGIRAVAGDLPPVRPSDNIELDLGFDSLKKIEFISFLESAFALDLPDTFFADIQTVGDVVEALKRSSGTGRTGAGGPVAWKDILGKEPSPEEARRIDSRQGPLEGALVYGLFLLLKVSFKLLFRLRVEGLDRLPKEGPFVLTPNHASYLDGFLIGAAVPFSMFRRLYFLGLQKFFSGRLTSWFARLAHVIPIDSEVYLATALQLSASLLRRRQSLCIFPEGGRSYTRDIMPFKKGIGVLALETGVPVVPVYIDGAAEALPRGARGIQPVRIRVVFGAPLTASAAALPPAADPYQAFADAVRQNVILLGQR